VNLIFSHASKDGLGSPQKKFSDRSLQTRQFSTNSSPYGEPKVDSLPNNGIIRPELLN
jgi:hypothetical protein